MQQNGLQDKRVIILGGSSGIGLAVAEQASSQGANVVVVSSNPDRMTRDALAQILPSEPADRRRPILKLKCKTTLSDSSRLPNEVFTLTTALSSACLSPPVIS